MRKAIVPFGVAAVALLFLALAAGVFLRSTSPLADSVASALPRWMERRARADALVSALTEQQALIAEYRAARVGWEDYEPRIDVAERRARLAARKLLEAPQPSAELRRAAETILSGQEKLASHLREHARMQSAGAQEAAELPLRDALLTLRAQRAALEEAQSVLARELQGESALFSKTQDRLGWIVGLLLVPAAAVLSLVGIARRSAEEAALLSVRTAAEAAPATEPAAEVGDDFMSKAFGADSPFGGAFGAQPQAPAATPEGAPNADMLNLVCREFDLQLFVLERKVEGEPPFILWASENAAALTGADAPVAGFWGKTLEEAFPHLKETFEVLHKGLQPGQTRHNDADLGAPGTHRQSELLAVQPDIEPLRSRLIVAVRTKGSAFAQSQQLEETRQKLAESEERLKEITQAKNQINDKKRDLARMAEGFNLEFEVKPDNSTIICTDIPDGLAELHGRKIDDFFMDGNLLTKHVIRPDQARVAEALMKSLADLVPLDVEYGVMSPNGVERWLQLKGMPRRTPENWTRFTALLIDRTEQHHAQEAARLARERIATLEFVSQVLPEPIFCLDVAKRYGFSFANKAAEDHFGYPAAELIQAQMGNMDGTFDVEVSMHNFSADPKLVRETTHECAGGTFKVTVEFHHVPVDAGFLVGFIKQRTPA